jgi:hypothetical protein
MHVLRIDEKAERRRTRPGCLTPFISYGALRKQMRRTRLAQGSCFTIRGCITGINKKPAGEQVLSYRKQEFSTRNTENSPMSATGVGHSSYHAKPEPNPAHSKGSTNVRFPLSRPHRTRSGRTPVSIGLHKPLCWVAYADKTTIGKKRNIVEFRFSGSMPHYQDLWRINRLTNQ